MKCIGEEVNLCRRSDTTRRKDYARTALWRSPLKQTGAEGAKWISTNLSGKRTELKAHIGIFFVCIFTVFYLNEYPWRIIVLFIFQSFSKAKERKTKRRENKMLEMVALINGKINGVVWGPVMLALLIGTGIYLTLRTNCIQASKFGYIMKKTVGTLFDKNSKTNKNDGKNLTPFQAVTTALAGTVGTGNIAGVTGAIFVGGPGAVFLLCTIVRKTKMVSTTADLCTTLKKVLT